MRRLLTIAHNSTALDHPTTKMCNPTPAAPASKKQKTDNGGTDLPATHPHKYRSPIVVDFFYKKNPAEANSWICKNCNKAKKCDIAKSYSNLRSHCITCLGVNYEDLITEAMAANHQVVDYSGKVISTLHSCPGFVKYDKRTRDCLRWMKAIVLENLPLCCLDKPAMRDLAGCKSDEKHNDGTYTFCTKSMRQYILALTAIVEKKIKEKLRGKIVSVMFDGWEHRRRKYVGVFVGYEETATGNGASRYEEIMLCIQPTLRADENGTADAHVELLMSTLDLYGIDIDEQVVCVGADK